MLLVFGFINRHTLSLEAFDWTLPETTGYRYISNHKKDGKHTEAEGSKVVDWSLVVDEEIDIDVWQTISSAACPLTGTGISTASSRVIHSHCKTWHNLLII